MSIEYDFKMYPLSEEDGGGFYAEVPALPGCMASGDTPEETMEILSEAIESWKMAVTEAGGEIPSPTFYVEENLPSGRFSLRMPATLHRDLIARAKREKESLNSLVVYYLTQAVTGDLFGNKVIEVCRNVTQETIRQSESIPQGVWKAEESSIPLSMGKRKVLSIPRDRKLALA